MSLQPHPMQPVPDATAVVARAAFPNGNPFLQLRDELGTIDDDTLFASLYPHDGQPAVTPWRLAMVTVLQFADNLPDRQAADAVRSRIDWKYLLGLELTDPGCDYSVLCEVRARLVSGDATDLLLNQLLPLLRQHGILKNRGQQRTDSTHILAAVRARYAVRAGIGGTISQTVGALGMRRARYRGAPKTHLQHVATATASNLKRLVNWWNEVPLATTKQSRFAALMAR